MLENTTRSANSPLLGSLHQKCLTVGPTDLVVEPGNGLIRVSVKTRSETASGKADSWFVFDERLKCDWIVFLSKTKTG